MITIDLVRALSPGKYRVEVHIQGSAASFDFSVDQHHGIDVVTWDAAFDAVKERNAEKTKALLQVIMAFHRAHQTELT